MSEDLPEYYFRIRDNGAAVFRVDTDNRNRRMELVEIATVNTRNGNVKPHGDTTLSKADLAAIADWRARRREVLAARETDDIQRAIEQINLAAQWVQSRATPEQLAEVTDDLLLAMHDLRTVLVRKKAESLTEKAAE